MISICRTPIVYSEAQRQSFRIKADLFTKAEGGQLHCWYLVTEVLRRNLDNPLTLPREDRPTGTSPQDREHPLDFQHELWTLQIIPPISAFKFERISTPYRSRPKKVYQSHLFFPIADLLFQPCCMCKTRKCRSCCGWSLGSNTSLPDVDPHPPQRGPLCRCCADGRLLRCPSCRWSARTDRGCFHCRVGPCPGRHWYTTLCNTFFLK